MIFPEQRPLMKKKPPAGQEKPEINQQPQPKIYNHAARGLIIQTQTILELSIPAGRVKYTDFSRNFLQFTRKDFEVQLLQVQDSDPTFSLDELVDNLKLLEHMCTLQRRVRGDVFVFTPFQTRPPPIPQPNKKVPSINRSSVTNSVPLNQATSVNSHSSIESSSENSYHSHNGVSRPIAEKPKVAVTPYIVNEERMKQHQDYSRKLFSKPSWPWLNDIYRERYRDMFLKYLQSMDNRSSNYQLIFSESKQLATKLWESTVPNFPHLLYLLHLLGKQNPRGIHFFDLKSEINKVVPETWRKLNVSCDDLLSEPSMLILQNLIVPSGPVGSNMVEVNQLISNVGFYEIWDQEVSMMYFFIGSSSASRSTESVHEFMCEKFPGWSDRYNKSTGADRVKQVCFEKGKMFRTENNLHSTKSHSYKIAVPMIFPKTTAYTLYSS